MVCGLVAATLAALLYGLGLGAHAARAGTPAGWQAAQAASTAASVTAVPTQGVELYPTDTAPATAQAAAAPVVKAPQMVVDDQTAGAQTSVTQQQPTNVVISIRIDSPGDNGPISQTNVAVGAANGTNDAATGQNGASGGGQDASTNQQAGANTTVNQDQAGNLVVTVRINSPGNNGPVSQTNAAAGSSNAQNSSETSQGGPSQAPAHSVAPAKAAAGSSKQASRRPVHHRSAPATPVAAAPSWHSTSASPARAVPAHHPSAHRPRHVAPGRAASHRERTATLRGNNEQVSAGPLGKAISDAGDLLGTVTPRAPIGTPQRAADVSGSVLYSLLVVLGLAAAFVAWSVRPAWRRQRRFGSWLLR